MKKIILVVLVLGMVGWAVFEYISSSSEDTGMIEQDESLDVGLSQGQIAPDFMLKTLDGEEVTLSDFRGQPVIINFWATWCPPCRAEMPDFERIYESEDVEILAVNLTESERNTQVVHDFIEELDLTFLIPMDEDSTINDGYNVAAYPTSYMIDSEGRVQFVARGAINYDILQRELAKLD